MNHSRLAFALVTLLSLTLVFADDLKPKDAEGFASLFNGADLTGWNYPKSKDKAGKEVEHKAGKGYQVKDGVLFCTKADGGNLYTDKQYANFAFRFEFKLTESANNGIGIRAPMTGDNAYNAMEIQVLDNDGKAYKDKDGKVTLQPWQYHGSIYNVFAAKPGFQKPIGEWNSQEIRADGTRITVTLNGTVITDADLATVTDPAVLKKHPGLKNPKGHIGFLGHGSNVEFRNIRIKELP